MTHNLNMVKTRKTLNILRCFFSIYIFFSWETQNLDLFKNERYSISQNVLTSFFGVLRRFPTIFDFLVLELICLELFKILLLESQKFEKILHIVRCLLNKKNFCLENHKTGSLVHNKIVWLPNFFLTFIFKCFERFKAIFEG